MAKRQAMAKKPPAMAKSLKDVAELNYLELSDSTAVPGGRGKAKAAPSLGDSCSSAEQWDSETSPACDMRERSRCVCASPELLTSERSPCKKPRIDVTERIAEMDREKEQRLQKFMVVQQALMAKLSEEREERLQKFMAEQQVRMAKMNAEKEERLQKFIVEQQVVMAKIIADVARDTVRRRARVD